MQEIPQATSGEQSHSSMGSRKLFQARPGPICLAPRHPGTQAQVCEKAHRPHVCHQGVRSWACKALKAGF